MTIAPTAGASGVMFGTSFYAQFGGSQLTMYDYANGNVTSPTFGNFLGTLPIPATITNIQGVAWKAPYFYFSSSNSLPGGNGGGIERVLYQNGVMSSTAQLVWNANASVQGIGFQGNNILEALQTGGSDNIVATFASSRFNSVGSGAVATWNCNRNGSFSDASWDPAMPNAGGATAIFGNGTTNVLTAAAISITVDAPYLVGSLIFDPTNGTNYTLAGDNIFTHAIMLTSGAGTGALVSVSAGSQTISANLVLADGGGHTFNIAPGSQLTVSGSISESFGSRSLALTGGGTLLLAAANTYSGGTTLSAGTVQTSADGALGSGPLRISLAAGATGAVQLASNESVANLSANIAAGGSAVISETAGKTLAISGNISKSYAGTLELQTVPVLSSGAAVTVSSGVLRFNVATAAAPLGPGVSVSIASGATLELAGTYSGLSQSVNVANNSQAADGGLLVSGTGQQVGRVTGAGNTVVAAGSDLTAAQIVQNSLTINGAAGNLGSVTLAPSGSGSTSNPTGPNDISYSNTLTSLAIANDGGPAGSRVYFGTLDIGNNGLVVAYGSGADPYAQLDDMVRAGYNGGIWTGAGITSSLAQAALATNMPLNIGLIDFTPGLNGDASSIVFEGQTIATNAVLLRLTYMDDLILAGNMSQNSSTSDALLSAANYGTGTTWSVGDLTHEGVIDSNDALLFSANYTVGVPSLDGPANHATGFGGTMTAAPEPSSALLGILGGLGLRRIARRRASAVGYSHRA